MPRRQPSIRPPSSCPICGFRYNTGILGWDKHIGTLSNHPTWHPKVLAPKERQELFEAEFPEFFGGALTPNRRTAPSLRATGPHAAHQAPQARPSAATGTARCPTCGGPVRVKYESIEEN